LESLLLIAWGERLSSLSSSRRRISWCNISSLMRERFSSTARDW
jgi:hypothetical protein